MPNEPAAEDESAAKRSRGDGRALGLDALRGLAILLMCLSGILPGALPNWMYHGYYPTHLPAELNAPAAEVTAGPTDALGDWEPVTHKRFRADWPSFSWVDAVFPMFLFAMGAAIPLALGARRARGDSWLKLLRGTLARFGLLVGFAVYVQHVTPYFMENPPGTATWWIALLAMVPPGLVLTRLPRAWSRRVKATLRVSGWIGAVALVAWTHARSERAFTWEEKDLIILLLAWSSLLVTLAALVAGRWAWVRLVLVLPVALLAHHQSMRPGWRVFGERFDPWMDRLQRPKVWLDRSEWAGTLPGGFEVPADWLDLSVLYDFTWFKFAGIVVLGTLVGDVLWKRQTAGTPGEARRRGFLADLGLTALLLAAVVGTFAGLKDYATTFFRLGDWPFATPYAAVCLGALPATLALWWAYLGKQRSVSAGRETFTLVAWGAGILMVGIALALLPGPALDTAFAYFEGGIKKGRPSTLSWYLVSLGVSVLLLAGLTLWLDVPERRWPRRLGGWLIANGQNPMLAYLGIRNLLAPLVALPLLAWFVGEDGPSSVNAWMLTRVFDGGPWEAAAWAGLKTLGLALVVWGLTWRRIVWRS